jgi:hypothetical protein
MLILTGGKVHGEGRSPLTPLNYQYLLLCIFHLMEGEGDFDQRHFNIRKLNKDLSCIPFRASVALGLSCDMYICRAQRDCREGWPQLTVEPEVNGNSERTNERGPFLVGTWACRAGT